MFLRLIKNSGGIAMGITLSNGGFTFELERDWAKLPSGPDWYFKDVAGVGVDAHDRVYVFNRGPHPMIIFNKDGEFIKSWGEGVFTRAHGITMGPDDTVYCTDDGDHTVRRCTLDGRVLMTLGVPHQAAPFQSGKPFNRCTHVALSPDGEFLFVTDGYGNSSIHKYTKDGKHVLTWGEPGTDPGQFNIVHNIAANQDGDLFVADRENHRVQIFDGDGNYKGQWNNMHRPCAIYKNAGFDNYFYLGELGPAMPVNWYIPNLGPRLTIMDEGGKVLARIGDRPSPQEQSIFSAPHGIAVDSRGDVYVGEVTWTNMVGGDRGHKEVPPGHLITLQKLHRR